LEEKIFESIGNLDVKVLNIVQKQVAITELDALVDDDLVQNLVQTSDVHRGTMRNIQFNV
jgi:ketosteroid isomerase-like protein